MTKKKPIVKINSIRNRFKEESDHQTNNKQINLAEQILMDQASSTMLLDNKEALRFKRMNLFETAVTKNTKRKLLMSVFGINCFSLFVGFVYLISLSNFFKEIRNSFKSKTESLTIQANLNSRSLQFNSYLQKAYFYNQGIYSKNR